jgi:maleate isomerase
MAVQRVVYFKVPRIICVATPYIEEVNQAEKEFLTNSGFKVVELKSLDVPDGVKGGVAVGYINPEELDRLIKSLEYDRSDGIFISCTNLPTISSIALLEDELNVPIISSNTSTIWKALRKMGSSLRIRGYGKLLDS